MRVHEYVVEIPAMVLVNVMAFSDEEAIANAQGVLRAHRNQAKNDPTEMMTLDTACEAAVVEVIPREGVNAFRKD